MKRNLLRVFIKERQSKELVYVYNDPFKHADDHCCRRLGVVRLAF